MFRYRDTQLQVTENVCDLRNLGPNIYQCFKIKGKCYFYQLDIRSYTSVNKHRMSTVDAISAIGDNGRAIQQRVFPQHGHGPELYSIEYYYHCPQWQTFYTLIH